MNWLLIVCIILLSVFALSLLLYWLVSLTLCSWDKTERESYEEFEADWNKFMRKR